MMQHSLSDTYLLASKVKSRLTKEAVKSNVNLRVLVCQANLLDNLIDYLNSSTDESNTSSNNNSDTEEDKLENNNNNNNNKNVESKVSFDDIEEGDLSVTVHQERENQHDSKTKITTSEILLSDDEEQDDDGDHNNSEITDAMEISRLNKLSHIEDNTSFEEYYEYDDSSDDDSDYESDYEYVYEDVSSDEGEDEEDEEERLSESKLELQVDNEEEEEDEDEDVEYSTDVRLNLTRCHSQNEDSNLARLQKTSNLYLAPEKSVLQSTEDLGLSRLNSLMDEEQIEEIEEEEIESDTNHHDLPSLSYCSSASSSDIEDNESDDHSHHHHHHHHHHNHNNQTKDTINDNKQSKNINSNIYPAVEECDLGDINELTKMYGQTNAPQPHLVYA